MGSSQRRKGHNFERAVAILFRNHFKNARRGLQYGDGSNAPDVDGTPFWIECKVGKKPNPRAALEQATEASNGTRPPVAVVKDDRKEPFVVIKLDDFLGMIQLMDKPRYEMLHRDKEEKC